MGTKNSLDISVPRVLIAAANKGAGLSTITLGALVCLKKAGIAVAVAKIGPSLVDTAHHRRISGRLSHNLDFWLLSRKDVLNSLARLSGGAELVVIEGDGGLFDKYDSDFSYRDLSEFAVDSKTPVVLVIDANGFRESLVAFISGYDNFNPNLRIAGIIANKVASDEHNAVLKKAVEECGGPRYLGGIPMGDPVVMSESGGVPGNLSLLSRSKVISVGDITEGALNIEGLMEIASESGSIQIATTVVEGHTRKCRIAVADDAAFHLVFQDNLDLIRRVGAEIVPFSPLVDLELPKRISGIYFPGGYVHLYAADLQSNVAMKEALKEFADNGGIIYAEGSALAYLMEQLTMSNGETFSMVGIVGGSATTVVDEISYIQSSYCDITTQGKTVVGNARCKFRGIRNFRWLIRLKDEVTTNFRIRDRTLLQDSRNTDEFSTLGGITSSPSMLFTAVHVHWGSNPEMAEKFIDSACAFMVPETN